MPGRVDDKYRQKIVKREQEHIPEIEQRQWKRAIEKKSFSLLQDA